MTTRDEIARIVCCAEHGGCILKDCDPEGDTTACIALKGYHDTTIDALMAVLSPPESEGEAASGSNPLSGTSPLELQLKRLAAATLAFLRYFNPCHMAEDKSQQWQSAYDQATTFTDAALRAMPLQAGAVTQDKRGV